MEPTWKLVFIDDITGIAIYEGGGMRVKAYPGTTHYPVPELGSGSAILDSIVLNRTHLDLETGIERISKHTVPWWHTKIASYEDPDLKSDQEDIDNAIDRSTWYVPITRR